MTCDWFTTNRQQNVTDMKGSASKYNVITMHYVIKCHHMFLNQPYDMWLVYHKLEVRMSPTCRAPHLNIIKSQSIICHHLSSSYFIYILRMTCDRFTTTDFRLRIKIMPSFVLIRHLTSSYVSKSAVWCLTFLPRSDSKIRT